MNADQYRQEAERMRLRAAEAFETSEYPRYGRAVYSDLAAALDDLATVLDETEPVFAAADCSFARKRACRVARLKRKAAYLMVAALRKSCESHDIASRRPFSQPILVGHHSERGHRNDLARQHQKDAKARELFQEAQQAGHAAEAAEANGAISSDDENAQDKLAAKITRLEQLRDRMKAVNADYRRCGGDIDRMTTITDEQKAMMKARKEAWYMGPEHWRPFAGYQFTNTGAEIRRLQTRVEELSHRNVAESQERETGIPSLRIVENVEANRIQLRFDHKPEESVRLLLKQSGFRWSPRESAWQRHLNDSIGARTGWLGVRSAGERAQRTSAPGVGDRSLTPSSSGLGLCGCAIQEESTSRTGSSHSLPRAPRRG